MAGSRSSWWRWVLVRVGVLVAVVVAAVAAVVVAFWDVGSDDDDRGQHKIDMPLATSAERIQVHVPPNARDTQWAYISGFQDDVVLISFRMPEGEVEAYLRSIHMDFPLSAGTTDGMLSFVEYGGGPDPTAYSGGWHSTRSTGGYQLLNASVSLAQDGLVQVWLDGAT